MFKDMDSSNLTLILGLKVKVTGYGQDRLQNSLGARLFVHVWSEKFSTSKVFLLILIVRMVYFKDLMEAALVTLGNQDGCQK